MKVCVLHESIGGATCQKYKDCKTVKSKGSHPGSKTSHPGSDSASATDSTGSGSGVRCDCAESDDDDDDASALVFDNVVDHEASTRTVAMETVATETRSIVRQLLQQCSSMTVDGLTSRYTPALARRRSSAVVQLYDATDNGRISVSPTDNHHTMPAAPASPTGLLPSRRLSLTSPPVASSASDDSVAGHALHHRTAVASVPVTDTTIIAYGSGHSVGMKLTAHSKKSKGFLKGPITKVPDGVRISSLSPASRAPALA